MTLVHRIARPVAWMLAVLSALGFALSLAVHGLAWLGRVPPGDQLVLGLHIAAILFAFPMMLITNLMARHVPAEDVWKAALRGCPGWMKFAVTVFFVYAFVNFAVFMLQAVNRPEVEDALALRGFSGHWMIFYMGGLAMMTSYLRTKVTEPVCPDGHPVSPFAAYCATCGQPIGRGKTAS